DAACASSLAALYSSVQELRSGASDVVFLAAADTHNQPGDYLSFSKTHAFSKTGRCRTFDATADGIVISEGMAMMILKRVEDAERDGDRIYAVIKGVGGSSDGRDLSLTAPRPQGQMLALERAYEDAGFSPSTVELVEAHGTGTVAGDKAEIEALKQVFDQSGADRQNCAVGSVKTMIGHTKAAAGLASLIKVTKALHHKVLPPTLGVTVPNPSCDFENSPFYVNSEARPWVHSPKDGEHQRRAGVSAFGFGGTNFHCVLEEYKPVYSQKEEPSEKQWPSEIFTLSSNSRGDMIKAVQQLGELSKRGLVDATPQSFTRFAHKEWLKAADKPGAKVAKVEANGATAQTECRLTIVAESFADLIEKLKRAQSDLLSPLKFEIKDPRGIYFKEKQEKESTTPKKIAFLFPGQGSQQTNMLADLAITFPTIRKTFERADAALGKTLPRKLSSYIFPPPSFTKEDQERRQTELTDTRIAQPAIGAAGMAAFNLLHQFGINPDFTAGHSYGEYVALCASGALTLNDLIRISELRGRLLTGAEANQGGSMAAVTADRAQVENLLSAMRGVTLANINAPNQIVISGAIEAVTDAVTALKKEKIAARTIPVSQAFHSEHMLHAKEPLKKALQAMTIAAPQLPTYSNTDAQRYTDIAEEIAERLANHIVKPVDFVSQIRRMQADGAYYFVEVGPGSVLTNLTAAILQDTPHLAVSIDRSGRNGITQLLHALAQLWAHGVDFDLRALFDGRIELVQVVDTTANQASAKPKLLFTIDSANINRVGAVAQTDKSKQVSYSQPKAITTGGAQASTLNLAKNTIPASITHGTNPAAKESATRMTATTTNQTFKAPATPQNGGGNGAPADGRPHIGNAPGIVVHPNSGNGFAGNGNGNGHAGNGYATNGASTNGHQPVMNPQFNAPANPQGSRPAANGNVDQVMVQFQQTMLEMTNSFLKTQQQVMTAYLMAKSGTPMPMPQMGWQPPQMQQPYPQQMQQMMFNPSGQYPMQGMPMSPEQMGFAQGYPQQLPPQLLPAGYQNAQAGYAQQLPSEQYAQQQQPVIEQSLQMPAIQQADSNGASSHEVVAETPAVEVEQAISSEKLVESLLDIVSQRTGYPPEMLDPELDLEADLGIDSIKRVEILNSFRKLLPEAKQRELEGGLEQLAGTKTLKGIIDWISTDNSGNLDAESAPSTTDGLTIATSKTVSELLSENGNGNGHSNGNGNGHGNGNGQSHDYLPQQAVAGLTHRKESASGHNIKRAYVEVAELVAPQAQPTKLPDGSISLIIAGDNGTYEDLGRALAQRGEKVMLVKHTVGANDGVKFNNGIYELDTTSPEAVSAVLETIRKSYGKIGRLINLLPLSKNAGLQTGVPASVASLLNFTKSAYADLNHELHAGLATVTTATKCGGTFGSTHNGQGRVIGKDRAFDASVGGFMKCLAKEWAGVRCKAVDFEETAQSAQIANILLLEL
ncbi:MAG: acyltransferase domain-containing protein, partial [Leptolyngbya sp.]|nr:acyltransferase domain-containing protein [Candidatus Melainabacteria bacterium]